MTEPQWRDGEPANLGAAAADALEWLDLLRRHMQQGRPMPASDDAHARLTRCADELRRHLRAPKDAGYEYECAHCGHRNDYGESGHVPNGTRICCENCGQGFTVDDFVTYMWPVDDTPDSAVTEP